MIDLKNFPEEYHNKVNEIMEHRYRYYVLSDPQIPDVVYDMLERDIPYEYREFLGVGSDLRSSYPQHILDKFEE